MRETFKYKNKVYPSKCACIAVLLRECKLSRNQIAEEVSVKVPTVDSVIRTIGFDRTKLPANAKKKKAKKEQIVTKKVTNKEENDVPLISLVEKKEDAIDSAELILNICIICGNDFYAEEELEICPVCVEKADNQEENEGGIAA